MVRTNFKIFLAVIFALAAVLAVGYVFLGHPGDPKSNVKPLDTSMIDLQKSVVA